MSEQATRGRDRLWRGRRQWQGSDGPGLTLAVLVVLAVLAVVPHAWGQYVADNRFSFYWAPLRGLQSFGSLWQSGVDLGGARPGFAPAIYLVAAFFDGIGLPPWLIQRAFHVLLLVVAGSGAAAVFRRFAGPDQDEAGARVAGILYMVSPFVATFLMPSFLYLHAALAPWLLLIVSRGVTSNHRWRWAATFVLVAFVSIGLNPPGFAWALLPSLAGVWYVATVERRADWRSVLSWGAAVAVLMALVLAPVVWKAVWGSGQLAQNLGSTETAAAVSRSSSWPETWRALGFWISYFTLEGAVKLHTRVFFTSTIAVLVTFAAPVVALITVWASSNRARLLAGAMLLLGGTAMVGAFPVADPAPFGGLLLDLYDAVPWSFALRNTYKAAPALVLGTAVLGGLAVSVWRRRVGPGNPWRPLGAALLAVFVVTAGWPLWSGDFYRARPQTDGIPDYWLEATSWLDDAPGRTRVLTVPGTPREEYRWGTVVDGIMDALTDRPTVQARRLSPSPRDAADAIDALDEALSSGTYVPGTLAPIARRLGIEYLVIRNDLRWERLGSARPTDLDGLRSDPDLVPVRDFGRPGENTTAAADNSPEAAAARDIPPVEILRIPGVDDSVRAAAAASPLLVAGDGAAWSPLARDGLLDGGVPISYTARQTTEDLVEAADAGSQFLITDTNRRLRASVSGAESYTLAASDRSVRVEDQFGRNGSQSVADFGDALTVRERNPGNLVRPGREHRPAAAVDRDLDTAWLAGFGSAATGQELEFVFARPTEVDHLRLVAARPWPTGRRPAEVTLDFGDGDPVVVELDADLLNVRFPSRTTRRLVLRISRATPGSGPMGFSEIEIVGQDITEEIRLPDDVFRRAADDDGLQRALNEAGIRYRFERLWSDEADIERAVRRSFRTVGRRAYQLTGRLSADRFGADRALGALTDGPITAVASFPGPPVLGPSALTVVDGRETTGWTPPTDRRGTLEVRFDSRSLGSVEVVTELRTPPTPGTTLAVEPLGAEPVAVAVEPDDCAPGGGGRDRWVCRTAVPLFGVTTEGLRIPTSADDPTVLEVRLEGEPNPTLTTELDGSCRDIGVVVDGVPILVRPDGTVEDLLAGRSIPFEACSPVVLDEGTHRFSSGQTLLVDSADLAVTGLSSHAEVTETTADVEVLSRTDTSIRVRLSGRGDVRLVSGQAFDARWRASGNGVVDDRPRASDTQSAWIVSVEDEAFVTLSLPAQQRYQVSLVLSFLGLALCVGLVWMNPASTRVEPRSSTGERPLWWDGLAVLGAFLIGSVPGAVFALAGLAATRLEPASGRRFAVAAAVLVAAAALLSIPPLGPELMLNSAWAVRRDWANLTGQLAAVALLVAVVDLAHRERRRGGPADVLPE